MTTGQLAALVEQLLDLQRQFFRAAGPHREELLKQCKAAERHLRRVCGEILHPAQDQPGLFGNDPVTPH